MLTGIHRQAERDRAHWRGRASRSRSARMTPSSGPCGVATSRREQLLNGGQVICGRNDTRRILNAAMKQAADFTVHPEGRGEKIICLRNRHDLGLVNGMFLELSDIEDQNEHCFRATARTEDGDTRPGPAVVLQGHFDDQVSPDPTAIGATGSSSAGSSRASGAAITCHKAQGSQWETMSCMTASGHTAEDRARWLYTAITRAERGLVILQWVPSSSTSTTWRRSGPSARFDVDLIVARLRDTAETGAAAVPERAAPRRRMAARQHPRRRAAGIRSCVITLRGAHAGDWIDFDGNHGGGPIGAIEEATGLTGYELIAEAAEIAGVTPERPPAGPAFQPAPRRDPAQEIGHILAHASSHRHAAERYLAARGLVLPCDADLLFHPDLTPRRASRAPR